MAKDKEKYRYRIDYTVGLVILVIMLLLTMSCSPCERLARKCPPVKEQVIVKDTVTIETIITDTIMKVDLPEQSRDVHSEMSKMDHGIPDTAYTKTDLAEAWAWHEGGITYLTLSNLPDAELRVPYARTNRFESYSEKSTDVNVEYRTNGFVKLLAWVGGISLFILAIFVIIKVGRLFN